MAAIWHPPDLDDLVRRYSSGESPQQLASELGVSRHVVVAALRRAGVPIRGLAVVPATDEMLAAYEGGESALAMSVRLGISRTSVTNRLRAAGAMMRGTSDNGHNSYASRCRAALTKEVNQSVASPGEQALIDALGPLRPTTQRAVGPYNLDIAILPVAVEVLGSDWHNDPVKLGHMRKRTEDLFGCGWNVLYVRSGRIAPSVELTDEIAAFVEKSRRDPTFRRQHRVLRSDGSPSATFSFDLD